VAAHEKKLKGKEDIIDVYEFRSYLLLRGDLKVGGKVFGRHTPINGR